MHATLIASLAACAAAAPLVERRQAATPPTGVNDAVILNYALSLEHLENTFYREALQKFSSQDFESLGLPASFYNNLQQIAKDEQTHVDFLTTGLTAAGARPAKECTYKFPYTNAQSFLALANTLEGVGVSAYLGAAQFIQSADYLTAAGSILTVESRHSAYIRDSQRPDRLSPFPAPFDIPIGFNKVFSLAAQFITACPDGTDGTLGLPFQAFPAISVAPAGIARPGEKLTFTVAKEVAATKAYFITFPGGAIPAEISGSGATYTVTVPEAAQPGQAYVVLTSNADKPTDDNIVAGPAVFEIADNAADFQAKNGHDYTVGKPDGYGKHPEAPKYDAPKKDEGKKNDYPVHKDEPKHDAKPAPKYDAPKEAPKEAPKYDAPKKDEGKKNDYPVHKDEPKHDAKPVDYPVHKDEPKHDDKPVDYPVKHDDTKKDAEKKPEDCDEYGNPKSHY